VTDSTTAPGQKTSFIAVHNHVYLSRYSVLKEKEKKRERGGGKGRPNEKKGDSAWMTCWRNINQCYFDI